METIPEYGVINQVQPIPRAEATHTTHNVGLVKSSDYLQIRRLEIQRWLSILIPKVEVFRGITIIDKTPGAPNTFLLMIENELVNDIHFDEHRRVLAELAILRLDWTFKKRYFIELSDFYPSEKQIEALLNPTMILLTRQEFALKIRKAKEEGKREAENEQPPALQMSEREKQLMEQVDKLFKEKTAERKTEAEYKKQITDLRLENIRLQNKVEAMKDSRLKKEREVLEEIREHNIKKNEKPNGMNRIGALLKQEYQEMLR